MTRWIYSLILVTLLLSACGAYALPGSDGDGNGLSSGSKVDTDSAVGVRSKSCSGDALNAVGPEMEKGRFCDGYGHDFSGRFFYREDWAEGDENTHLGQYDRTGRLVQSYDLTRYVEDKSFSFDVALVNEREIYLVISREEPEEDYYYPSSLWRIPLKRTEKEERPCLGQMEWIFAEDYFVRIYFISEDWIVYASGGEYREYDRRVGENICIDRDSKERYCPLPNKIPWCDQRSLCGQYMGADTVLLARLGKAEQYPKGLYVHRIGSGKVTKLRELAYSKHIMGYEAGFDREKCFFTGLTDVSADRYRAGQKVRYSYDIFAYDCDTGEDTCLVPQAELEKWMKGQPFWSEDVKSYQLGEMHLSAGRLYILLYIEQGEDIRECWIRVGCEDGSMRYEESLTKAYLRNDAYIQGVSGDQICFSPDNTDDFVVYDFKTGRTRRVKRGTVEYGCWEGCG